MAKRGRDFRTTAEVVAELVDAARRGFEVVTFTGGEPKLYVAGGDNGRIEADNVVQFPDGTPRILHGLSHALHRVGEPSRPQAWSMLSGMRSA